MNEKVNKFGRIGVLMGGYSSEREISLKSGKAVYKALKKQGCQAVDLDIVDSDEDQILSIILAAKIDLAFIALHGQLGEDGKIQSLLDKAGIPYTGSNAESSRQAFNKAISQDLFKNNGIQVPEFKILIKGHQIDELNFFPSIVKPACEGSSIGISIVRQKDELESALNLAWQYGEEVLVERYIEGRELTVGILDQSPLSVIEICPHREFFDFEAKYQQGLSDYVVPAKVSENMTIDLQTIALKAHKILGCSDFSRVDFILKDSIPYVLEINTIPGFTATSLLPKAAQEKGMSFEQLCFKLVELNYGKKQKVSAKGEGVSGQKNTKDTPIYC